jgi:nitrogen fixation protein FixH
MPRVKQENFQVKLRTITSGKIEENKSITTQGRYGAFRIVVNPLERDERSKVSLQITGFARSNGILELRCGQWDEETQSELGEQMVFETVQYLDAEVWTDVDLSPKKGRRGRGIKRKRHSGSGDGTG